MTTDQPAGDWNASRYDRVADPQTQWGAEVLERLPLEGSETVLLLLVLVIGVSVGGAIAFVAMRRRAPPPAT